MIRGVNHITLAVADMGRFIAFYRDALAFRPVAAWSKGAYLEGGALWLALILDEGRSPPKGQDYTHIALDCAAEDFPRLRARLEAAGPEAWSENRSEGASHYFRDPDGHQLEIHVGDLETRLKAMRENPWEPIEFFD